MTPVKLVIIGAGVIGRRHIELAIKHPSCELIAICDVNSDAATVAEQLRVPFYQDTQALLCETEPEGAIIATPTDHHAEAGIACAQHGVHVLVEKPVTATVEQAEAFLQIAERKKIQVLVGHHRRHNPLIQATRNAIQRGKIGKLIGVSMVWALLKPQYYYDATWRTLPGGGPILINLIHDIDTLRYICGEIEHVYAIASSETRGFAVEDTAGITLRFKSGAIGTIFVSDATPSPRSYELTSGENSFYPEYGESCYHFFGTKGSLDFPQMRQWHYQNEFAAGWQHPLEQNLLEIPKADPLVAQLEHFCQIIRGTEEPIINGQDGPEHYGDAT